MLPRTKDISEMLLTWRSVYVPHLHIVSSQLADQTGQSEKRTLFVFRSRRHSIWSTVR